MNSRLAVAAAGFIFGVGGASAMAADAGQPPASNAPLTTIETLDVPRYMGTWYEIAKYPNRFQRDCIGNTRADYQLMSDGKVQVTNRCDLKNGEVNEAVGTARQVGAATSPRLKVRFAPAWLAFIPAVWGDYWVIDLDDNYQLAAVSEPGREYLWVLARRPRVEQKSYDELLARLRLKGFNLDKLEVTRQAD